MEPEQTHNRRFFIVAFFLLIFFALIITWGSFKKNRSKISIGSLFSSCTLSKENFCDGKTITLIGKVDNNTFVSGLGYLFIPKDLKIPHQIFVRKIELSGIKPPSTTSVNTTLTIPFGEEVEITGRSIEQSKVFCDEPNTYVNKKYVCDSKYAPIILSPEVIMTSSKKDTRMYSAYLTKLKNSGSCDEKLTACEDNGKVCFTIKSDKDLCSGLGKTGMIYVQGYAQNPTKETLVPIETLILHSVDFGSLSKETNPLANIDPFKPKRDYGVWNIFDKYGERLMQIDAGSKSYYNAESIIPLGNVVYYIVDATLYQKTEKGTVALGTFDSSFIDKNNHIYPVYLYPDRGSLIVKTNKLLSQRTLKGGGTTYGLTTDKTTVIKIDLASSLKEKKLVTEILFEREIEGFITIANFNPKTNKMLLSYEYHKEWINDCQNTYLEQIDIKTHQSKSVGAYITKGNNYCAQPIYRILGISKDGQYIAIARDYNPNFKKESRLLIIDSEADPVDNRDYIPSDSILETLKINDIYQDRIVFQSYTNPQQFYTFNFSSKILSLDSLEKTERDVGMAFPPYSLTDFVHEDEEGFYYFVRAQDRKQLYLIRKKDGESIHIGDYSLLSSAKISDEQLYIVDYDY